MNIKDQIETKFNLCVTNNCIETYAIDFDVLDDRVQDGNPRPCYKVDFGQGEFSIENNGNLVHFLKVDDCILLDTDGKKCDFAVFTTNEFVFIELKEIEVGTKSGSKKKGNKKRSCYPQLESTLNEFINNRGVDFSKYQDRGSFYVVAAVFDTNPPISKMPAAKTASNAEVRFAMYDAKLLEGNIYSFEWKF